MKIKYYSCDTLEHEEEVLKIECVSISNMQGDWIPEVLCTRPNGDDFEVDFDKVVEISS